ATNTTPDPRASAPTPIPSGTNGELAPVSAISPSTSSSAGVGLSPLSPGGASEADTVDDGPSGSVPGADVDGGGTATLPAQKLARKRSMSERVIPASLTYSRISSGLVFLASSFKSIPSASARRTDSW